MPRFIMKAQPDKDLYVDWSTVVDSPLEWGTAQEMQIEASRLERADMTGTTAYAGSGSWKSEGLIVRELGTSNTTWWLPRENLAPFLESLGGDDGASASGDEEVLKQYCTSLDGDED